MISNTMRTLLPTSVANWFGGADPDTDGGGDTTTLRETAGGASLVFLSFACTGSSGDVGR